MANPNPLHLRKHGKNTLITNDMKKIRLLCFIPIVGLFICFILFNKWYEYLPPKTNSMKTAEALWNELKQLAKKESDGGYPQLDNVNNILFEDRKSVV